MNKKQVIEHLSSFLKEELTEAKAQPPTSETVERIKELDAQILMYRFLPTREHGPEDEIVPSSLVKLKTGEMTALYLVVPRGGGLITAIGGQPLQVITPHSPLGESLLGKKLGDRFSVEIRGVMREYSVLEVC